MGSNFDGQYNLLASNCGTTNPNLFFAQIAAMNSTMATPI